VAVEPAGSRYRLTAVRAVTVAFVLVLAACASGGSPRAGSGSTIPLPKGTAPVQSGGETCLASDLAGPVLPMPAPQNVAAKTLVNSGIVARLDPAPGATPAVSASSAWRTFTHLNPLRARRAELLLGTFSAFLPYGRSGPQRVQVLAWVLRVHHLAYAIPSTGDSKSTQPVCEFVDAVLVLDATNGSVVVYSY